MDPYLLAKIVQWSGTLRTRKKMQKIVYLLQAAGCPFSVDYLLHHYGPYSSELAQLTDEMVRAGILEEECVGNMAGQQFNYRLLESAERSLSKVESTPAGQAAAASLSKYEALARRLVDESTPDLEVASTIAYFRRKGEAWEDAIHRTCEFKRVQPGSVVVQRAEAIAKQVLELAS
jgi:uncharacterized protein YwgA